MVNALQRASEFTSNHPVEFWILLTAILLIAVACIVAVRRSKLKIVFRQIATGHIGILLLAISSFLIYNYTDLLGVAQNKYVFGIDFSSYQEWVNWNKVPASDHPIDFVILRASMGGNGKDSQFHRNWYQAKEKGYIRGAYHYYRPDEDPVKQFRNYAARAKLQPGDLPPMLDIEKLGAIDTDSLVVNLITWMMLAEEHYQVKPILYSGRIFYRRYLRGHFKGHPLWIASYSPKWKIWWIDWTMHQFSDKVRVSGIGTLVDGNDFNGTLDELKELCIQQ